MSVDPVSPYRPRVSRETRLLLMTAFVAVAALWVLARIRFPDLPATSNPVPPVMSQIGGIPRFADLAAEMALLQARLEPSLLAFDLLRPVTAIDSDAAAHAALRIGDGLAITWLPASPSSQPAQDSRIVAWDRVSGLATVRVVGVAPAQVPNAWSPRRLEQPRYLIATDVSSARVSLRPVFVGALEPFATPLWPGPTWLIPRLTDVAPGSFVFSFNGDLVGAVIGEANERVIVPADGLLSESTLLRQGTVAQPSTLGIEVQSLTPPLSAATGAANGVVVVWIAEDSDASLAVGDVIEAIDAQPLAGRQQWDARITRLSPGETISVRVRRGGQLREVQLTATSPIPPPASQSLGLTMRRSTGIGTEVMAVAPGSVADRSGLVARDLLTLIADVTAPTPAQIGRVFTAAGEGSSILIAVTRGERHFVATLDR